MLAPLGGCVCPVLGRGKPVPHADVMYRRMPAPGMNILRMTVIGSGISVCNHDMLRSKRHNVTTLR